jgi:hypothetical protein
VIDEFEESYFYMAPLISFSLHPLIYAHLHILYSDCFESNPLASSPVSQAGRASAINLRTRIFQWHSGHLIARQPGKLLTAKDAQVEILVRDRFRLSATVADAKVCLSLRAFALGETLREFECRALQVRRRHSQVHPNQPARHCSRDISS